MGKFLNFFKSVPNTYYNWRKRNEKIDTLLENYSNTLSKIDELQDCFSTRTEELRSLQEDVRTIIGHLDTVKH